MREFHLFGRCRLVFAWFVDPAVTSAATALQARLDEMEGDR